ncbi:MAG TPA: hypothetical protein VJT50_11025 [Pyrinomonadaceae bacterium]|nr:hypothetical protein [Pyrinomonadaceae bacterium]
MAARLKRELKIEIDTEHGRYGEYKIFVDGELVIDGGARAALGILPSAKKVVSTVQERLAR